MHVALIPENQSDDTILFPVNYATWHAGNFGPQVLEKAKVKGMGILCLKAMAKGALKGERRYEKCWYEPLDEPVEADLALRFTLSHPVTAAIPPGEPKLFEMAVDLAKGFTPLTADEAETLKAKAAAGTPLFRFPSAQA